MERRALQQTCLKRIWRRKRKTQALRDILRVKGREVSQVSLVDIGAGAEYLLEEQLGEGRREK